MKLQLVLSPQKPWGPFELERVVQAVEPRASELGFKVSETSPEGGGKIEFDYRPTSLKCYLSPTGVIEISAPLEVIFPDDEKKSALDLLERAGLALSTYSFRSMNAAVGTINPKDPDKNIELGLIRLLNDMCTCLYSNDLDRETKIMTILSIGLFCWETALVSTSDSGSRLIQFMLAFYRNEEMTPLLETVANNEGARALDVARQALKKAALGVHRYRTEPFSR